MVVDLPREIALKILYDINQKGAYSNIAVNKYLESSELQKIDKAFITELVYGTLRWRLTIDWIIGQFSTLRRNKISDWVLNILRMGIYQLVYMEKVPQSAACNESVKLSKKYGHKASSGYVNAVLRNVARNRDKIVYPDKNKEYIHFLSIKYSHPQWMVDKWVKAFGGEFTEKLLAGNNEAADFTVRVNTLKISRSKLIEELKREGIEAVEGKYTEEALVIKNPSSVSRLESFKKGYFQVQDESSMLAVKVLDPQPGEFIMDVCSAPGGKASHIAQLMENRGTVLARDIYEHKISLIESNIYRMGLNIVKTEIFDATVIDCNYVMKADRVLVDAPCTGLGIIRRKPEIKWSRNMEDIKEITKLQAKILRVSSSYVKPGGVLVYSTCTINPEENEEIIREFIGSNTEFKTQDISCMLPENMIKPESSRGCIQMFPNIHGTDGFFIARMRRMKS
jgi:16S rRNA (cytosine967-C5)-methyltransferase